MTNIMCGLKLLSTLDIRTRQFDVIVNGKPVWKPEDRFDVFLVSCVVEEMYGVFYTALMLLQDR